MITAHIATIPERLRTLRKVVEAVVPQVNKVYVELNGHQTVPKWLRDLRFANCEMLDNSLGDAAKWLHCNYEPSFCVFIDDDLIVPRGFVSYLMGGLRKYGGAVGLHGRNYPVPVNNFRQWSENYRCLGTVTEDKRVHLLGTGCMLFDNTQTILDQSVFEHRNMADVLFARFCHKNNIPMMVLKHKSNYLKYIPQEHTIWRSARDTTIHTEILKSFLK